MSETPEITKLIADARAGDRRAVSQLFRIAHYQLRRMAGNIMRGERPNHILQPTALVNELYLKLFAGGVPDVKTRLEFFALCARAMRNILLDHARRRDAQKRREQPVSLQDFDAALESDPDLTALVILAQRRLAREDARAAQVVDLYYFADREPEQIAELLEVNVRTIQRELKFGRLWLRRELIGQTHDARTAGTS